MPKRENFRKEVTGWQKKGIISSSQAQAILAEYGLAEKPAKVSVPKSDKKENKLITVISTIGALLIGLGVILFVGSNWQVIPTIAKLIILSGGTFATYFAGWKLQYSGHPKAGHSLLFLGSLFTGATIFLVAQIFNIQANIHWLLLLWFIAVAPLSYGFNSKPTLILSLLIFAGWLGFYIGQGVNYDKVDASSIQILFMFYGLTLFGVGYLHERTKFNFFSRAFQGFGMLFTLSTLYVFLISVSESWNSYLRVTNQGLFPPFWLFYVFFITALISVSASVFYMHRGKGKIHEVAWNLLAFLSVLAAWFGNPLLPNIASTGAYWGYVIIFHSIFFALVLLTIFSGYHQGISSYVNIGLLFFVLYILYLYFTTFVKYLPKSLAFIIGGIILLAGGWFLENKRREIIQQIERK